MTASDLVDPFGRIIRDLRISVTDRCNFRCTYCMPEEGLQWLSRDEVLNFEEIERLAGIFVRRFGVEGIRLTGGEPTVRAHLDTLITKLAGLGVDLAMTTNGATLQNTAERYRDAGLNRINISLDSLDRARFEQMTRRDELRNVLAGIDAAIAAGFSPVKINTVIERGVNDDEIVDLAAFGRDGGHGLRAEFLLKVADHHFCALAGEEGGLGGTQAAGTAGNQSDLARHTICHSALSPSLRPSRSRA